MAEHVCPVWIGYMLASPLRRLYQNPDKILGKYINKGMTVLDVGCAMGFFSVPMAKMVGENGKVVCIDVQQAMLDSLAKRARKAGVESRIEQRLCAGDSLGIEDLEGKADFALAFAMVHEAPDINSLFRNISAALKSGAKLLVSEPKGHVTKADIEETEQTAKKTGFDLIDRPNIRGGYSLLFEKK